LTITASAWFRGETIVDVTDIVDPSPGAWPPVAMNRLIAEFTQNSRQARARPPREKEWPLSSVKLLTPVPWPNKIIAYPVNYHSHGIEMGSS